MKPEEMPNAECQCIELVLSGLKNRFASRFLKLGVKRPLDFYGQAGYTDCFSSVLGHPAKIVAYKSDPKTGAGVGSIADCSYPVSIISLPYDFDGEKNVNNMKESIAIAQRSAIECYDGLVNEWEIPPKDVYCYFSGNRGFHVIVYDDGFPSEKTSINEAKELLDIAGRMAQNFDEKIYSPLSLLRVANTIHSVSGLYKIPLAPEELRSWPIETIQEAAKNQRTLNEK